MQIQIHTDHNIEGHEVLAGQVSGVVKDTLSGVGDRITHVDVHLSNQNSDHQDGFTQLRQFAKRSVADML